MPKTFIRKTGGWTEIKSIFVKKTTGWAEVKNVFLKKTSGWVKVFTKASLPDTTTAPSIRTTNTSGVGDQYDGPVATSPQFLNADLFGKDGVYTNYTSIFGRKFTRGSTSSATSRTTIVNSDRFTSAGGVTTAMRTACDEQYLFYELTVQNGSAANEIYPISPAIKMIKSYPATISFGWNEGESVGTQLAFNYSLENYYYNSIEPGSSYIRWWRSSNTNPGGTLIKQETITDTTTGTPSSTSRTGTSYYTPTSSDIGYYIVAEIIAVSSYTRHEGYTDNYSLGSFPTDGVIGSALTFSNVAVKDYYDQEGLDNRDRWPTGTLNQYTGQLSGYDSNTTIRIRYRVYNYDTGLYWKPSTGTQTTASAAWDSWNSDGSGNGYISNVTVNGTVATFSDYFDLSSTPFNGGGSGPTWWLEVELSALRGGPRVYYNNSDLIPEIHYISKRIDPTVSVSPSTVGTNANVTISGTFAGFPATPSTNAYPRQYIIYYGDGNNSGYLPAGEWANGTLNPTYSNTWSYSSTGTYTVTVRAVPHGEDATATVTVANLKTAPTITSVSSGLEGAPVTAFYNGGSGPFYQMYWTTASSLSPTVQYTPDASGSSSSQLTDNTGPTSASSTYYMYIRSVQTAGETSVGPSTLASAWSSGYPFTVTSSAVSQISAPTARATNTFSTSIVKYLDSITWSAGTYNNASTITSVLLYSTSSSNLVAGQTGNTLSSFRTANPYTIVPSDPAGTPYIFAVRDTVVGTNGTTYYFFGNQITSANADAVAFSYGLATSSAGGWSASINSGAQTGATYSYVSATAGSGTVNSSTGAVTASGLTSGQSSTITVNKAVSGYNTASTTASGTALTVTTYTLSYSANGGSTTPTSQTGAQGDSITLAANAGTRSGFSFGGWNIGGTTYSGGGSYTFGSANATATAIWTAVFVTPTWNGTMPGWTAGSNFQRITSGTANYKWSWTNGTFSFSGSIGSSRGWNFNGPNSTQLSAGTARGTSLYKTYTTTNDTYTTVQGVSRPYLVSSLRGDVTYNANPRYGSIQPYQFGTDGNEYTGPWTAGI
jgi:hypothetical protein